MARRRTVYLPIRRPCWSRRLLVGVLTKDGRGMVGPSSEARDENVTAANVCCDCCLVGCGMFVCPEPRAACLYESCPASATAGRGLGSPHDRRRKSYTTCEPVAGSSAFECAGL